MCLPSQSQHFQRRGQDKIHPQLRDPHRRAAVPKAGVGPIVILSSLY